MNQSNLKNMVILKNLPSNIVEEAIIILKSNKKIRQLEKIENNKTSENIKNMKKENNYIVKEAEMIVSNYISALEAKKKQKSINNKKINKKYTKVRNYAYIASLIIFIESLIILIK